MIRLMAFIPNPIDATSFYRGMGPLTHLVHSSNLLVEEREVNVNWATLSKYDALFMQRPFTSNHAEIVKMAYDNGIPIWLDYDDDLFNVPTDNPVFGIYQSEGTQKTIATMIAMADKVSVSTAHLAERLSPINPRVTVIPNAFDDRLLRWRPVPAKKKQKCVMWRGTNTHHKDLVSVGVEIISLSHEHRDLTWVFLGWNPWFLTDQMPHKNVIVHGQMEIKTYWREIAKMKPGITMVPLLPSIFNKSKSNIAWIEGVFAGSAVLAPHWDEWRQPGVVTYGDQNEFKDKMKAMFTGQIDLAKSQEESWEYIKDCLLLSKVNTARAELLQQLTGKQL